MLETILSIATIVGSILGSIISCQTIYKNHLEIKKLQRELDEDKDDSG